MQRQRRFGCCSRATAGEVRVLLPLHEAKPHPLEAPAHVRMRVARGPGYGTPSCPRCNRTPTSQDKGREEAPRQAASASAITNEIYGIYQPRTKVLISCKTFGTVHTYSCPIYPWGFPGNVCNPRVGLRAGMQPHSGVTPLSLGRGRGGRVSTPDRDGARSPAARGSPYGPRGMKTVE